MKSIQEENHEGEKEVEQPPTGPLKSVASVGKSLLSAVRQEQLFERPHRH